MTKHQEWTLFASLCLVAQAAGCTNAPAPADAVDTYTTHALLAPIRNDFEDGTAQGWFPFGLTCARKKIKEAKAVRASTVSRPHHLSEEK